MVFLCMYVFGRVVRKVAVYLGDVLEDQKDKLQENLLANGSKPFLYFLYVN